MQCKSVHLRDLHSRSSEPPSSQSSNRSHCSSAGTHRWLEHENSDFPQGLDLLTTSTGETKTFESYTERKKRNEERKFQTHHIRLHPNCRHNRSLRCKFAPSANTPCHSCSGKVCSGDMATFLWGHIQSHDHDIVSFRNFVWMSVQMILWKTIQTLLASPKPPTAAKIKASTVCCLYTAQQIFCRKGFRKENIQQVIKFGNIWIHLSMHLALFVKARVYRHLKDKTYHTCQLLHLNCLHSHPRRHTTRPAAYTACCCTWSRLHGTSANLQTFVEGQSNKWVWNLSGLVCRCAYLHTRSFFVHPWELHALLKFNVWINEFSCYVHINIIS